jgi:pimeloyl-ACP methyl ester carboxylesterase
MPIAEKLRTCENSKTEVSLFYDDMPAPSGDVDAEVLLWVPGLGGQYGTLDTDLAAKIAAAANVRVIRIDNRDVGLSTKMEHQRVPVWHLLLPQFIAPAPPYTLEDMALDAWALLDRLGVERAHLMGASMGGMVVQWMAALRPEATRSVASLISTTGGSGLPRSDLKATLSFIKAPKSDAIEDIVDFRVGWLRDIAYARGGVMTAEEEAYARRRAGEALQRTTYRLGSTRHIGAIQRDVGREAQFAAACNAHKLPVLALHGDGDLIFPVEHAHRVGEIVPHARVVVLQNFGHSFFPSRFDEMTQHIAQHVVDSRGAAARDAGQKS